MTLPAARQPSVKSSSRLPVSATPPRSVLVVGAGLAGTRTVAALRTQGFGGRITLVGEEPVLGYDRPPLSKELFSRPEPAWFHEDLGVDVRSLSDEVVLDDPAIRLDGDGTVITHHQRRLAAEAVVLAIGSVPVRVPGWDHALTLRTANDAQVLRERLGDHGTLAIVGAGWIGAEVAGVAAARGHQVTVVEAQSAPLALALGHDIGARFIPWYQEAGVRLLTSRTVADVAETGLRLTDGAMIDADVVLSSVGARPGTAWLHGAIPLLPGGGIPTDAGGRVLQHGAPVTGLYAVGDCAVRADHAWGQVPAGHWSAALHDPDLIAHQILAGPLPPAHVPYVFSTQLGHDVGLIGIVTPEDKTLPRATPEPGWSVAFLREGMLHGVLTVDQPREVVAARKALRHGPVPVDEAAVAGGAALRETVTPR